MQLFDDALGLQSASCPVLLGLISNYFLGWGDSVYICAYGGLIATSWSHTMGHNSQCYLWCQQPEWRLWVPVVPAAGPSEGMSSSIWLPADTEPNLDSKQGL